MRAVGIDLGERRIGVAVTDSGGVLASPYGVVERSGDRAHDRQAVATIVADVGAEILVVGLPLSLSGASGQAAQAARQEAVELASVVGVPVETFDERLTTVEATRLRRERGHRARGRDPGRRGSRSRGAAARAGIDAEAAAVMLGAWLEVQAR
ncbi:MAG: Holliday junction resolvase RuvX [Acidimicrobiales bacterium]|jgi:putative Holliday junction resolvase